MSKKKDALREECIRLRQEQRLSYKDIHEITGASKGSLSLWLRDWPLTAEEIKERCSRNGRASAGRQWSKARLTEGRPALLPGLVNPVAFSTEQKGRIAEAAVVLRLAALNLECYRGVFDKSSIDFIVFSKYGNAAKVQVRWGRKLREGYLAISLRKSDGRGKSRPYSQDEVDFFVAYVFDLDTAYVISAEEAAPLRNMITLKEQYAEDWQQVIEFR